MNLDLDKIEEELKLIKSEDWRLGLTEENIWDNSDHIIHESLDEYLSMEQKIINAKFFFKSKERIAALVKRCKELERWQLVRRYALNNFCVYPKSIVGGESPYEQRTDFMESVERGHWSTFKRYDGCGKTF